MTNELSDLVDKVSEIYKKECKACKENRKSCQDVNLLGLKIMNYATSVKNVIKYGYNQ